MPPLRAELLGARLSRLLGCSRAELAATRERAAADWAGWVRRLLDDVAVEALVMDRAAPPGSGAPVAAYAELAGRPVWELQRLEPTLDAAVGAGAGVGEVLDTLDDLLADAAARGCVGVKTVLAYRTGLAVDPAADRVAAEASLREPGPVRTRAKPLRDLALRRVLGRCAELGLAVQVHTGFGDSELSPRQADPLLLDPLLRTPEGRAADVVLIHGGWPWHDAVGYLAGVHANVWAEFSLVQLFAPAAVADRLLRLVEAVPPGRLLLGSDGHGSIESVWYGCALLHEAWDRLDARLADLGVEPGWRAAAREAAFGGNARAAYRLPGG